jgi:hypothetical protein
MPGIDEGQLRAHLRLYRDRNQAAADRELADYEDRDCDDPRRPELLANYHGAKWATAAYADLLRRLDAGEFRPAGHGTDTDRVHQEIDQVIRVRLNDELYQEMWDRVQKDCPGLPKWTMNGILTDIFGMLLGRSCEFLFEDPPAEP